MALSTGMLGRGVGMGGENDRADVIGVKRLMQELSLYEPPPEGFHDAIDADFDRSIRDFQEDNGLKIDGLLLPGGETERNLIAYKTGEGFDGVSPDQIAIGGGVGFGGGNDTTDVSAIKRAFGALDRYRYDRTRPPPPYIDSRLVEEIEAFQRENGLFDDGLIAPGGETLPALRDALAARQNLAGGGAPGSGRPAGVQVAFAPAIVGAVQAGRALLPYAVRALGLGGGVVAGQAVIDAAERTDVVTEPLPQTPPFPAEPPEGDTNPPPSSAEPIQFPIHTGFPIPDDPGMLIEVFPNQSDEFNVPQIYENSRGNEETQELNTAIARAIEEVVQARGFSGRHSGGAFDEFGNLVTETYLKNALTKGRKGSSRTDITFISQKTDRRLFINTADRLADGTTPTSREHDAGIRIILNGESGGILVLVPKPGTGKTIDFEALKEFLRPMLEEIDQPKPDVDPRAKKAPEELMRRWFPPKM